uniref:Uncharacterized protein n=1 Tax=Candidatus Methanogaster sp. ANME-2c ERB4 TaxID=2759911 RepID=A0A7G9Y2E2_9EURY|nr:hypothetical protein CDFINFIG_00003 [Methanosarcinales archaeon ANME-2c ERB4]QNO42176.1 hypothetical protein NAKCPFIE_00001 [Methanosarcinales archaeon ANME-2c ERB4]QNO42435.1 hypothetical protein ADMFNEEM_00001 [Methanosarcinales archaeon ANME-2c ERB4]QNO42510.1 hypothetical protein AHMEGOAG_00003 [Methanosarcinales archaeon ANME-2c ERB4]QNO42893.1 hypothetical protein JGPBEILB_00009 [Methanosarcinales archaeon ANME-2c ERB4]
MEDPSDHDLLIRIDERVESIDNRLESHAKRIRLLEKFKSWCLGGFGVLASLFGWLKFGH